jgi:hypothetical protein
VVEDSKKVDDFLNGIQDPGLMVGKTVVLSNPFKLGDFEACQQYLSTLVANMSNHAKYRGERNGSSAIWEGAGDNSTLIDRVKGGQFQSFSKEEKDCVARYWEESKKKKKGKRNAQNMKRGSPRHSPNAMRRKTRPTAMGRRVLQAMAPSLAPMATITRNPRNHD